MDQIQDEQYCYTTRAGVGWCRLQVYQGEMGAIIAIATEQADNPGPSITAAASELAEAVWRALGAPAWFAWLEHYPGGADPTLGESWALVRFTPQTGGRFTDPYWVPLPAARLAECLAGATNGDLLPEMSLPLHRPTECTTCGQALSVAEVMAGIRRCAGCREGRAPEAAPHPRPASASDRQAALRAWHEGINAQEIRLGLNRRDRAAWRGALLRRRDPFRMTPAELEEMARALEQLADQAAVRAFLASQPSSGRDAPADPRAE